MKWWQILSGGGLMFIYNDGKYKMIIGTKKTNKARMKEIYENLIYEGVNDQNVVAIVWSSISFEYLENFIY
jgi:L-2-hydroxyglutarate oxidase LhgO